MSTTTFLHLDREKDNRFRCKQSSPSDETMVLTIGDTNIAHIFATEAQMLAIADAIHNSKRAEDAA